MNRWTLHITDFGKIKQADVEVAPLTFLIGDNNSGKSYLMTLIYGLLQVKFFFGRYEFDEESETYRQCCAFLDKLTDSLELEGSRMYSMNRADQQLFIKLINETLRKNKQKFLKELFNREMEMGELWVEMPYYSDMELRADYLYDNGQKVERFILAGKKEEGGFLYGYGMPYRLSEKPLNYHFFLAYIMEYMLQRGYKGKGSSEVIYLPTTRTGFLLTYKTLIGSALEDKFTINETEKNLLTRPNSDFLRLLSSMNIQREKEMFHSVIEFIEESVIEGHIDISDLPAHDILYTPKRDNKQLPMYITSGVVTEMTPLLLFLKYMDVGTLLIEEPEISLHPKLQWKMARLIIQLQNAGVPVFVTTHSDIILQHINNMLKLAKQPDAVECLEKFHYVKEDLVQVDKIAVYQFDVMENGNTQIEKLPCGDYGYEAMTFYNTLWEMNQQIEQLEDGRK